MTIGNIIVSSIKLDKTLCDKMTIGNIIVIKHYVITFDRSLVLPSTPVSSINDCKDMMLRFWCLLIKTVTVLEFHVFGVYDYYNVRVVCLYGYLITSMIHYPTYHILHEGQNLKKCITL
jgi:hypothetical protein